MLGGHFETPMLIKRSAGGARKIIVGSDAEPFGGERKRRQCLRLTGESAECGLLDGQLRRCELYRGLRMERVRPEAAEYRRAG